MIVQTANDLELIGCCGCLPTLCDEPRKECESLSATGYFYGFYDSDGPPWSDPETLHYKTRRYEQEGGYFTQLSWNSIIEVSLGGNVISVERVETATTGGTNDFTPGSYVYSDGFTKAALFAEMHGVVIAALDWDDEEVTKGSSCEADKFTYEGLGVGEDYSETFVRYRIGVPENFSTIETPRTTYECQWDEGFFTTEWLAWKELDEPYQAALILLAEWEACEALSPGDCGEEPTVPTDPGPAPTPAPVVVASRSFAWAGSMEAPWSEWFDLTPPDGDGSSLLVNMLTICWRSTRHGQKPTSTGEVHEFA